MALLYVTFDDKDGLGFKFSQWVGLQASWPEIARRNATEMYNRGKSEGGTPVDTGELMGSLSQIGEDEIAYIKDYAAHVEFGHRTVSGGYVEGQRYLERNVEEQKPIFKQDILDALEA